MSEELGFTVDYSKLTQEQLKQLCKQNGLKTSGNRADLLARLNEKDDDPVEKVQEKIRVKCPTCSDIFDPRVSSFVKTHGVKINVQSDSEKKGLLLSLIAGLYFSTLLFGKFLLEMAYGTGDEGCFCCMLGLFWSLPIIGFSAALGDQGSYRTPMLILFGILSFIHTFGLLGFIVLLSQFAGSGF